MLSMSDINHIRDLYQSGYKISEIHKKTGADPKTIKKYLEKVHIAELIGRVCEAKRPHSVSERSARALS